MTRTPDRRHPGSDPRSGRLWVVTADRVFDGEQFLPRGTRVLVRNEMIVGVQSAPAAVPEDSEVLNHPGATLLPGLIDSHVHLCAAGEPSALTLAADRLPAVTETVIRGSLLRHLTAGVTAVRDLGDQDWAVLERTGRDDEPLVRGSGPPITTPGGHCSAMGGAAVGTGALKDAVRQRGERGAQIVKIIVSGGAMTAGSDLLQLQYRSEDVRLVVREAHRRGLPVTAHAHSTESVEICLAAGIDGIEHCTCLTDHGINTPPALLAGLASSPVAICPTFGRLPGSSPSPQAQEVIRRTGMSLEARFAQVGQLHRAGATLLAGSDAGIHPAKPHGVLPHAVIELVASGLSEVEALAAATSVSARACGLAQLAGRLRPGLRADLLIVDGDPGRSITDLVRVRSVLLGGRPVHQADPFSLASPPSQRPGREPPPPPS